MDQSHCLCLPIALIIEGSCPLGPLPVQVKGGSAMGGAWNKTVESFSIVPARLLGLADRIGAANSGALASLVVVDFTTYDLVASAASGRRRRLLRRGH
ncbi:hypothetical protein [Kitasatospora purpeofusca]|uniref:hypothetical protein n=1 Tax=Kitasatospora purpeofusca TaxID=67352 RepID=UPI003684F0CD